MVRTKRDKRKAETSKEGGKKSGWREVAMVTDMF